MAKLVYGGGLAVATVCGYFFNLGLWVWPVSASAAAAGIYFFYIARR